MKGRNTVKGNEKTQASRERTCELVSTCRVCPTQRGKKAKGKKFKSQISPQRAARDKQEEIDREKEHHSIVPLLRLMKSTGGGIFFVSFGAFLASASKQASKNVVNFSSSSSSSSSLSNSPHCCCCSSRKGNQCCAEMNY